MKKLIAIFSISLFLASCEEDPDPVSQVVTVGHPSITLIGDAVFSTPVGTGTFTDPGAVGFNDITGDSVSLTTPVSNTVDLTTPGFYSVTYNYTISNGQLDYTAIASRLVLVTPVSPSLDISGLYARSSNGQEVHVTKYGTGLYTTDNVGGVAGSEDYIFDVYFGQTSDSTIEVPSQPNVFGGFLHCEDGKLMMTPTDTSFSWIVMGVGFGTATRTFIKQ